MKFGDESDLFGCEKDDSFKGNIGAIYQSFGGEELYESLEEKAAHLLYFVTKNHSFSDGNKRIVATMFLYFLDKNQALYIVLALLLIHYDPAMAKENKDVSNEQETVHQPDIILVRRHSNWAWGYSDYGIFIDEEGNIYSFSFGDSLEGGYPDMEDVPQDEELLDILYEIRETEKPTDKANKLVVFLCDLLGEAVDLDAEFTSEHTACDAGQDTLYVVNNSGQLIEISSYGDNTSHRDCPVANIIDILYNTFIEDITF